MTNETAVLCNALLFVGAVAFAVLAALFAAKSRQSSLRAADHAGCADEEAQRAGRWGVRCLNMFEEAQKKGVSSVTGECLRTQPLPPHLPGFVKPTSEGSK